MGIWEYQYTDELYHHGIKGQKWGVRRYQDENGRLTPEGKKRYSKDLYKNLKKDDMDSVATMLREDSRVQKYVRDGKRGSGDTLALKKQASGIERAIDKQTNSVLAAVNRKADQLHLDPYSRKYENMVMNALNSDKKIDSLQKQLDSIELKISKTEKIANDRTAERERLARDLIGEYADKRMMNMTVNTAAGPKNIALTGSAMTELLIKNMIDD